MRTICLVFVAFFMVPLFSFTPLHSDLVLVNQDQDTIVVEAIFDGHEDYGYNFIAEDDDFTEYTLTFHEIEDAVSKEFNLNDDSLIGTKFKITYKTKTIVTKDDDGYEDEDIINTIVKLEKAK